MENLMRNLNGLSKWVELECGFEPHLSASKIALFANDLPSFICKYGLGIKTIDSPAMVRGRVIERFVVEALIGDATIDKSIHNAIAYYNDCDRSYYKPAQWQRQVDAIPSIMTNAYEALVDYGPPSFPNGIDNQERIEFEITGDRNEWAAPIVGYLDLVYPELGLIVDLKTTLRLPGDHMSWGHKLQSAFYKQAKSNFGVKFLYVSTRGVKLFEQDNMVNIRMMVEAKSLIERMNKFCHLLTPSQARGCIPTGDNIYWNDNPLWSMYNEKN